jgi:TPR repeat protein/serine/threonine protein kinase
MDKSKKSFNVTEEIRNLQRDIQAYEDSVVKYLSFRKARALSVYESRALKGDLQKLSLMISEIGAEIEYSKKAQDYLQCDESFVLLETTVNNISTDYEQREELVIGPMTKSFVYRFNRNILSKNDLYRKKEYLERERLLYDEVTFSDTVVNNWSMGEILLGKFENKDVAIKTMPKPTMTANKSSNNNNTTTYKSTTKNNVENQRRLLENEILTLTFLNKSPLFLQCYGCLMKESTSMDLILEYSLIGSLEDVLFDETNFPTFPLNLKFGWISDFSEALQFLYNQNIIHGDIQAKNLFLFDKMKLKLGNFHVMRSTLLPVEENIANNNISPMNSPPRSSVRKFLQHDGHNPLRSSKERLELKKNLLLRDPSLPFLPLEARTAGKEIDISFDVFSFAMTVIQILTRKLPQTDNFQQQIVQALHVSGLNLMDIRNRLFTFLSECVKFDPASERRHTRPTGDRVVEEMRAVLSTLGGDPRANQSQSNFINNLVTMALEKGKQIKETQTIRRKKAVVPFPPEVKGFLVGKTAASGSFDGKEEEIQEGTDFPSNSGSFPSSLSTFRSSSGGTLHFEEDRGLVPEEQERNRGEEECFEMTLSPKRMAELLNGSENPMRMKSSNNNKVVVPPMQQQSLLTPNVNSTSAHSPITSISDNHISHHYPLPFPSRPSAGIPNSQPLDFYNDNNSPRIQRVDSSKSNKSKIKFHEPSLANSADSYRSLDIKRKSLITTFLRERVKVTNAFAVKASEVMVKNGILDVEILKRRLHRDRELLIKLGLDEELAEDIYEVVIGLAAQVSFNRSMSQMTINMTSSSNYNNSNSKRDTGITNNLGNNNRMASTRSLTYCKTEQEAAEIAKLYYDASQCNRVEALQQLKSIASTLKDPLAEGFLMRIYALGQCKVAKDLEKAKKMGDKLYTWFQLKVESNASELKSIYARYLMAVCHSEGLGVEKDSVIAMEYYKECAERGYAGAQAYLGFCYYMGIGVEKNYTEAIRWYRIAADQGFSGAQSNLGICYEHGHGVARNLELASKHYLLSAQQGAAAAQYNLGNLYERGEEPIQQNFYDAAKWYIQAAVQGYTPAEYSLGCLYLLGLGVEMDSDLGIENITKAAEKNYILAQVKLGECYEQGNGVAKNPIKAIKWYYKAAENGNAEALYYIGYYHFYGITVERDLSKAVEFYTLAAERGHAVAQNNLAICYQNGFGAKKDLALTIKWFQESANTGFAQAQFNLGVCYEKGQGVTKALHEAVRYYRLAAENHNANAKNALERLEVPQNPQFEVQQQSKYYLKVDK